MGIRRADQHHVQRRAERLVLPFLLHLEQFGRVVAKLQAEIGRQRGGRPQLAGHTRAADVLVAAVGRPGLVTPDMVKPGATVVDVGVNRTEAGLVGDVDPAVAEVAGLMSPVPGGVGPMTIAMLLRNTLSAARNRRLGLAVPGP